jgi:hypothetical protein
MARYPVVAGYGCVRFPASDRLSLTIRRLEDQ